MIRLVAALWLVLLPSVAIGDAALTRLVDALRIQDYVTITRAEGLDGLDELAQNLLGRPADPALRTQMRKIYATDRMTETVRHDLSQSLTPDEIGAILSFLDSETGSTIMQFEVAARRAMSDPTIEEAAKFAWVKAEEERPWLVARITEVQAVSDLIERNVSGTLNSNLRFFQGLADGDGLDLTEDEMLADVWSQEDELRANTTSWLGAYLHLAYEPLSQSDLETYVAFWQTDAGATLNAALFAGFNRMYDDISYATGRVFALAMRVEDL